jgi:hypothetical protein
LLEAFSAQPMANAPKTRVRNIKEKSFFIGSAFLAKPCGECPGRTHSARSQRDL